jgi:ABC-2 type transport system ATP-binding protein
VPSQGDISVIGYNPHDRDYTFRKKIALVMGQKSQLWWDIPAMDSLKLLQSYYEIDNDSFTKKVKDMSKLLGVSDLLNIHVRKLSLGERMKLELMASLLHSPEIIFLDEPTIGLDLVAQGNIRKFLADYHRDNDVTIILTSHYMEDVKALCKRIVLISDGEKAYDGPIIEFEGLLGDKKNVTFGFKEPVNKNDPIWKELDSKWENDKKVEVQIPCGELRTQSLRILSEYPVVEFNTDKLPIENVMKTLMENPKILLKHD